MELIQHLLWIIKDDMKNIDYITAHKYSIYNRNELERSGKIGCYYCLHIFSDVSEIKEWVEREQTGLCPKCGIDSLIGDASGYSVNKDFLRKMKEYWFDDVFLGDII